MSKLPACIGVLALMQGIDRSVPQPSKQRRIEDDHANRIRRKWAIHEVLRAFERQRDA